MSDTFPTSNLLYSLMKRRMVRDERQALEFGVILMDLLSRDPKLASLRKIDEEMLYVKVKKATDALKNDKKNKASEDLLRLADTMRLRQLLGPLFNDPDSEVYGTISDTLRKYSEVLSQYETYDKKQKRYIISDLKRDLSALMEYIEKIRQAQKRDTYYDVSTEYVLKVLEETRKHKPMFSYKPRVMRHEWFAMSDKLGKSNVVIPSSDPYLKKPTEQVIEKYITIRNKKR